MHEVYKTNRDSRRISGPSMLEVKCHQYLDGMRPIVLTVQALYTNTALPRMSGDLVYNTMLQKY